MPREIVIFTDLDGTLLDYRDYSFDAASGALRLIKRYRIPLVITTSKTRAEVLLWRERLGNRDPFITENGGGIYVPKGVFRPPPEGFSEKDGFLALELGAPYDELRAALARLREMGFGVRGFGEMTPEEVARLTGLDIEMARLAREREFDEPFLLSDPAREPALIEAARGMGYTVTMGRVRHILKGSDKGRAVEILSGIYKKELGDMVTVGIGDSLTDLPMLEKVDLPVIVKTPDGGYNPVFDGKDFRRSGGTGPRGWDESVKELLEENGYKSI